MSTGYIPQNTGAPRTKALDHSKVAAIHKPSAKPGPIMPEKRPMVGTDVSANKKYGTMSHNNGYTN
jgi:hypothetical protein